MANKVKAEFKLGEKVWYIADGYITSDVIKGVLSQNYGGDDGHDIVYTFDEAKYEYNGGNNASWKLSGTYKHQADVFASKKALIKSIENQEEE